MIDKQKERVSKMKFCNVFPLYVSKVEKKGRSITELLEIIHWLTGYSAEDIELILKKEITFLEFFEAADLNLNAYKIKGKICGYRVEEITDPFMQKVRYLDKLVDELASGKKLDKILRS